MSDERRVVHIGAQSRVVDSVVAEEIESLRAEVAMARQRVWLWVKENGPGGWIDNLRTELAEKDKTITELKKIHELELDRMMGLQRCPGYHITESDIDAAWDQVGAEGCPSDEVGWVEEALMKLGIVACSKCGGTGHLAEENEDGSLKYATGGMPIIIDCPSCDERGYLITSDQQTMNKKPSKS